MGHNLKQKMAACLSLVLFVTSLWLQPSSGFEMLPEPVLRELTRQGHVSFDYIMNLVMMDLPESLTKSLMLILQSIPNPGGNLLNNLASQNTQPLEPNTGDEQNDVSQIFNSNDPIQLKRRKRFSDNFFDGYDNFNPSFNLPGYGYNDPKIPENGNLFGGNARSFINFTDDNDLGPSSSHNDDFGFFNYGSRLICPRQVDQGFIYQYSGDPTLYPAIDIANELLARSLPGSDLLFQCLSRQVVFPTDPPQIFQDPFLTVSNTTCPFKEEQVWSYESTTFTGRCWPLVNFQETPFFKSCLNRCCRCRSSRSRYGYYSNKVNLCITEYETVSLWSYCERLLPNRRIVRDRILVPDACTCTTVQCSRQNSRRYPWK